MADGKWRGYMVVGVRRYSRRVELKLRAWELLHYKSLPSTMKEGTLDDLMTTVTAQPTSRNLAPVQPPHSPVIFPNCESRLSIFDLHGIRKVVDGNSHAGTGMSVLY